MAAGEQGAAVVIHFALELETQVRKQRAQELVGHQACQGFACGALNLEELCWSFIFLGVATANQLRCFSNLQYRVDLFIVGSVSNCMDTGESSTGELVTESDLTTRSAGSKGEWERGRAGMASRGLSSQH